MAQTARNLKLLLLHFSSLALSWQPGHSFCWQRELQMHSSAANPNSLFTRTDLISGSTATSETIVNIFTFSALTLLTCSLLFHCVTPGLALEQSCSSSSLLLSVLPGKDLKYQSWNRGVGWEQILPTEHLAILSHTNLWCIFQCFLKTEQVLYSVTYLLVTTF